MELLRLATFIVGVISLASAMSMDEAKRQIDSFTTIGQVKEFCSKNGAELAGMKPKITASRIAEAFRPISEEGKKKCAKGMEMMDATEKLVQTAMDKMAKDEGVEMKDIDAEDIEEIILPGDLVEEEEEIDCDAVRATNTFDGIEFQSAEGECNNLEHPEWGAHEASLLRLAPPDYDGTVIDLGIVQIEIGPRLNNPIKFRGGDFLPGARKISVEIHGDQANNDNDHSYWLMQWGQFLDHDFTLTPTTPNAGCDASFKGDQPASCFNIPIPDGDPQFDQGNIFQREFIPLTRSAASDEHRGIIKPREQFNELTAFIDASNVYGSTQERQNSLRIQNSDGTLSALLRTIEDGEGFEALPFDAQNLENEVCQGGIPICFFAGDVRASEQIFLSIVHTLWVREHNRIVRVLRKLNSQWSENRLFHEARRIVASIHQHIALDEYLPNLIGGEISKRLVPPYIGYNPLTNPGIFNEFANAVYRLGHSQLRNQLARLDHNYQFLSEIDFRQAFFQPARYFSLTEPDATFDNYVRGLNDRQSQQIDRFISEELNNHLFEPVNDLGEPVGPGLDLASLNIQRGRDHGLASYLTLRIIAVNGLLDAGIPLPFPIIEASIFKELRKVYGPRTLSRIDPWVGGISETSLETALPSELQDGGQLGPTFTFVLVTQFVNTRNGDRFYFLNPHVDPELPSSPPVLTPAQIASIQDTSFSSYICTSANDIDKMSVQPQVFRFPDSRSSLITPYPSGFSNQRLPCQQVIKKPGSRCLDLSPWANDGKGCVDLWNPFVCKLFFHLGACDGSGSIGGFLSGQFDVKANCALTCGACSTTGPICFEDDI